MTSFDTPLLIVGSGPAALVAAKVASGVGLASILAADQPAHDNPQDMEPVELDSRAVAILEPHGVLGVLRPYATSQDPFAIAPAPFCDGLKHHCVADMLITVFDGMRLSAITNPPADGSRFMATLDDGRRTWDVVADAYFDAGQGPAGLNEAIVLGADFAASTRSLRA